MRLLLRIAPLGPATVLGIRRQPLTHLRGVLFEPLDPFDVLHRQRGFRGQGIGGPMARENRPRRGFQLRGLALKVRPRAAPPLRGVAGELYPVDGEHLAPDQALGVANRDHRPKHPRDVLAQCAHEGRDRREMRRGVAAQGDERHVFLAGPLDPTAADDALRVGEEHHLQQHRRRIRRRPRRVVAKARIEVRQIDRVIEQVVEGVLERPGQQLPRQIHGQEAGVRIDVLVASHEVLDGEAPARQIRPSFHPS